MLKLNPGQRTAVNEVKSGFLEKDCNGYVIVGEGGTGKTTCVMTLAADLLKAGMKVLFCAPTNKAVKQLEKSAREYGLNFSDVAFSTLHSALGLTMLPNEENKYAVQVGDGVLELFDVVVCDEASMLSKIVLLSHLMPRAQAQGTKLLLMGDDMQLPPVKEAKSLAFEMFPILRLTQVERQAENSQILDVTGVLRTAMEAGRQFVHPSTSGKEVQEIQAVGFLQAVLEAFDADTDLEKQRVLAWRNSRVDEINNAIRKKIYGKSADRFEVGERVVTGAPVKGPDCVILSTDEECYVESVSISSIFDEDGNEDYKTRLLALRPIYAEGGQVFVHVLHESDEGRYWDRLNELARKAKSQPTMARNFWARYHKFKELFATIKYCYCITVHRSQGSTYDTVFVDTKDILCNRIQRERQNLLYVAYSRPRSKLVINKSRYVA